MNELSSTLSILTSGMKSQSQRIQHIAENIANADTPGYRRKTVEFRAIYENGTRTGEIEPGRLSLDRTELQRIHNPSHPMADDTGHYLGSNVQLVTELADAREAQLSYEANLKMFQQVRRMSSALMEILKR